MRGGGTSSSPDDALLSRLFQQVTAAQEPRFATGYDLNAGLDRYQGWLRAHTEAAEPKANGAHPATAAVPAAVTCHVKRPRTLSRPAAPSRCRRASSSSSRPGLSPRGAPCMTIGTVWLSP